MSSVIHFRLHNLKGKQYEQIYFIGNGIRLLDLKREILAVKNFSSNMEFDLKVTCDDSTGKEYEEDDEIVPRNTSLVIKRINPKIQGNGLLSRLKMYKGGSGNSSNLRDIVLPTMIDVSAPSAVAATVKETSAKTAEEQMDLELMTEDEDQKLMAMGQPEIPESSTGGNKTWSLMGSTAAVVAPTTSGASSLPTSRPITMTTTTWSGPSYACTRCGKTGHNANKCPTIGDPTFDPVTRLSNVPQSSITHVTSLEGVDLKNKYVVENKDGTFDIIDNSLEGVKRMTAIQETSEALSMQLDMTDVPEYLKCSISGSLLKEAVALPCCKKCVDERVIRESLLSNSLKCPLCNALNISPDALTIRQDIRNSVEDFIKRKFSKTTDSSSAMVEDEQPTDVMQIALLEQQKQVQQMMTAAASGEEVGSISVGVGVSTGVAMNNMHKHMMFSPHHPYPGMPHHAFPGMPHHPWSAFPPMHGNPMGMGMGFLPQPPPRDYFPPPMTREDFEYEKACQLEERKLRYQQSPHNKQQKHQSHQGNRDHHIDGKGKSFRGGPADKGFDPKSKQSVPVGGSSSSGNRGAGGDGYRRDTSYRGGSRDRGGNRSSGVSRDRDSSYHRRSVSRDKRDDSRDRRSDSRGRRDNTRDRRWPGASSRSDRGSRDRDSYSRNDRSRSRSRSHSRDRDATARDSGAKGRAGADKRDRDASRKDTTARGRGGGDDRSDRDVARKDTTASGRGGGDDRSDRDAACKDTTARGRKGGERSDRYSCDDSRSREMVTVSSSGRDTDKSKGNTKNNTSNANSTGTGTGNSSIKIDSTNAGSIKNSSSNSNSNSTGNKVNNSNGNNGSNSNNSGSRESVTKGSAGQTNSSRDDRKKHSNSDDKKKNNNSNNKKHSMSGGLKAGRVTSNRIVTLS